MYHAPLTGFYQNCRGLKTKITNFKRDVWSFNYIFIVLIETWLTVNSSNSKLDLLNYNSFRYDRRICTSNFSCGEGGLIGVRKDISACSIAITEINIFDFVWCLLIDSCVTPIPKTGNQFMVSNYRPISVQSHISKIF